MNRLVDYHEGRRRLPELEKRVAEAEETLAGLRSAPSTGDAKADKKAAQSLRRRERAGRGQGERRRPAPPAGRGGDRTRPWHAWHGTHATIEAAVLAETAKLHEGDAENLALWRQFMPACMAAIEQLYKRLGVTFDETLGESFYHDRLATRGR